MNDRYTRDRDVIVVNAILFITTTVACSSFVIVELKYDLRATATLKMKLACFHQTLQLRALLADIVLLLRKAFIDLRPHDSIELIEYDASNTSEQPVTYTYEVSQQNNSVTQSRHRVK
jgi:hypothetical protein